MKYLFFALCFSWVVTTNAQGKLNDAKKDLSSKSTSTGRKTSVSGNGGGGGHTSIGEALLRDVFLELFIFTGKHTLFGNAEWTDLNIYPYYQDVPGEYIYFKKNGTDSTNVGITDDSYAYKYADLKASVNYFVGKGVNGIQGKVDFRMFYLLGLEGSYNYFYEDIIDEKVQFDVASLMLNYYRVRTKHVTAWWGLGASYVGSGVDKMGFAYNIGVDVFPVKPISFRLLWKQSFINQSSIDEFQLQGKYHFKRAAVYAGWNYFKLGSVNNGGLAIGLEYIIN